MKREGSIISKPLDPFKKSPLALIKPEGSESKSSTASATSAESDPGPSGSGCLNNMSGASELFSRFLLRLHIFDSVCPGLFLCPSLKNESCYRILPNERPPPISAPPLFFTDS